MGFQHGRRHIDSVRCHILDLASNSHIRWKGGSQTPTDPLIFCKPSYDITTSGEGQAGGGLGEHSPAAIPKCTVSLLVELAKHGAGRLAVGQIVRISTVVAFFAQAVQKIPANRTRH